MISLPVTEQLNAIIKDLRTRSSILPRKSVGRLATFGAGNGLVACCGITTAKRREATRDQNIECLILQGRSALISCPSFLFIHPDTLSPQNKISFGPSSVAPWPTDADFKDQNVRLSILTLRESGQRVLKCKCFSVRLSFLTIRGVRSLQCDYQTKPR